MSKVYVGIDIGLKGGLAAITPDEVRVAPMPFIGKELDLETIGEFIMAAGFSVPGHFPEFILGFEALTGTVHTLAGRIYNISMIRQLSLLEGWVRGKAYPFLKVTPAVWQKVYFEGVPPQYKEVSKGQLKTKKLDTKAMSIIASGRLYPTVSLIPTEKSKVASDGISDALGIAHYLKVTNR